MIECVHKGIFYKKRIVSKKPVLVLVHGIWGSSSAWNLFEEKLKGYNIISLDLRGHGKSFRPSKYSDYEIGKFAEDIYSILKKEKVSKAILVGNSFGNFVVLEFLRNYQRMVKEVILISPHYNLREIPLTKYTRPLINFLAMFNVLFPNTSKRAQREYSHYYGKKNADWDLTRVIPDMFNTGSKSSLNAFAQVYNYSAKGFLDKIRVPVLIIHGAKDSIFPISFAHEMRSRIKNSRIKIIPDAAHIMVLSKPLALIDCIKKELKY